MLDATVGSKLKLEVRGGRIRLGAGGKDAWHEIGQEPVIVGRNAACQVVVEDSKVSAVHAEFVATPHGVRVRDLGSRNGTFVAGVRVGDVYLFTETRMKMGDTEIHFEPARPEKVDIPAIPSFGPLVGNSAAMRGIFDRLSRVAPTDLTVLIAGETGSGKELVAQALHMASSRAKKPFIVVDCGSIPPTLAEATLFGHERGAFTGAIDKRLSPFQEAEGGTIFLDELGELPLEVQPKLLRALAERRIKAVGGNTYREVDVRVLAATRRDLVRMVNQGVFRSDLYFRIAQVKVEMMALRQRAEDIPILVRKMLKDLGDEGAYERVSTVTLERLMRHDWPGNVRELRNAVAVAHALAGPTEDMDIASHLGALNEGPMIEGGRLGNSVGSSGGGSISFKGRQFQEAKRDVLAKFERDYFAQLADESKGNVSEMARRAGMERAHVRAYLRRHGIGSKADPGDA